MKTIKVHIEDKIYDNIKGEVVCKRVVGNLYGAADEFLVLYTRLKLKEGELGIESRFFRANGQIYL